MTLVGQVAADKDKAVGTEVAAGKAAAAVGFAVPAVGTAAVVPVVGTEAVVPVVDTAAAPAVDIAAVPAVGSAAVPAADTEDNLDCCPFQIKILEL